MKRRNIINDDEEDQEVESDNKSEKADEAKSKIKRVSIIKHPHKKIKFCPFMSRLIYQKNKLKVKSSTIFSIIPFLPLKDIFNLRLTSKLFNESIVDYLHIPENVIVNKKWLLELKAKFMNNEDESTMLEDEILAKFNKNSSDKKFSKNKLLVKLISNKNFMLIKKRTDIKKMLLPKELGE